MTQVTQQLSQRDSPGFPGIMNSFPYGCLELLFSGSETNATSALYPPVPWTQPCRLGSLQRGKSGSPAPREASLILGQACATEALPGSTGPAVTVRDKTELSLYPLVCSKLPLMLLSLSCLGTFKVQPNVTPSTTVFLMSTILCTPYYDTSRFLLSTLSDSSLLRSPQ